MNLIFERRAEIALRSLQGVDRKKIDKALHTLVAISPSELRRYPYIQKVAVGPDSMPVYVYGGGMRFRLILAVSEETCTVLDIVDHDRLERLFSKGMQR